jgi:tripartite-type tricarboxylate transporter receptor subunit TctC
MRKTIRPVTIQRRTLLRHSILLGGALALAGLATASSALAQAWPTARPITLLNPFPAGGGTDAFARPLAAQLDQQLGQRVIVENRGGAGGTLGASQAAKMAPDGYTFFVGAAHHTIAPSIYPSLTYDLQKDFVPIAIIGQPPQVISMSPKAQPGIKTLKDLIDFAKANPGKLNFGSAGNGTTHHLSGELFKLQAGVDLVHLPYRGAGPAMQDLVAGKIDLMFDGLGTSAPQIQGGTLVGLAVASDKRVPSVPNVPTAAEAGLPGYVVSTWYAVFAIKGTPPDVIKRMQDEIAKALKDPKIQETWARNGSPIPTLAGAEFEKFVDAEIKRWSKVVTEAKVPKVN